jgi:hypothetical protein
VPAAVIHLVNNVDVLALPPHSSHLIQMYDVAVGPALKVTFKKELQKRTEMIMAAQPGHTIQTMRIALV